MKRHGLPLNVAAILIPAQAYAHAGIEEAGLMAGMLHPLSGLDHLLAMLAVGIISAIMGGASIWRAPAVFVAAMAAGAAVGMATGATLLVEKGITLSVILLGAAIAWGGFERIGRAVYCSVFAFGLCHGYAHGVELPNNASPLLYSLGFLVVTVFIHVCGIFVGELALEASWRRLVLRICGAGMAGAGVWIAWA